jgi:hypothetical protein
MIRRRSLTALAGLGLVGISLPRRRANASGKNNAIERQWFFLNAANDEWTVAPISATEGDLFVLSAQGTIVVGPFLGKRTPDSALNMDGLGAVTVKIGDGGINKMGSQRTFFSPRSGALKSRVHDTNWTDNRGQYVIDIIRIPGSLIPALNNPPGAE